MNNVKRVFLHLAVLGAFFVLFCIVDTYLRGRHQLHKGDAAAAAGDFAGAVAGYESAIHMYLPVSPYVGEAAEKLWGMGEHFRGRGDRERALIAYRALRSSFYAARWLTVPGSDWIRSCDQRIGELLGSAR